MAHSYFINDSNPSGSGISANFDNTYGNVGANLGLNIHTHPNNMGGSDFHSQGNELIAKSSTDINGVQYLYDAHGNQIMHSNPNIKGGSDFHSKNNELIASSSENIDGGQNVVDAHGNELMHSHPNNQRGFDFHSNDNAQVASSSENIHGGQDIHFQGGAMQSQLFDSGFDTVMGYSDPLAHVGSYTMPPFSVAN